MKTKHPNLPQNIVKFNKHFYVDSKTGKHIHVSNLSKYCTDNYEVKPVSKPQNLNKD